MADLSAAAVTDPWMADLSRWQGEPAEPAFEAAIAAGLVATMQKLTQGVDYHDPSAALDLYNVWSADSDMLEGGYHFGTNADPGAQAGTFYAAACLRWPSAGPSLRGVQLALDVEGNGGSTMSVAQAETFVAELGRLTGGKRVLLYMGKFGPQGNGAGLPSHALAAACDLWLPKYGAIAGQLPGSLAPFLPAGFNVARRDAPTLGAGLCRLWQFTDGTHNGGPQPGLGRVDQSRPIGFSSPRAFRAWWLA